MNPLKYFWVSCGSRSHNFGDEAGSIIVGQISGREIEHCDVDRVKEAELCGSGSILHLLGDKFTGYVWGSGFIQDDHRMLIPNADVRAVRGKLTAKRLMIKDIPLGDPLLLWQGMKKPKYRLGIVPHYIDFDNEDIARFSKKYDGVLVIDMLARDAADRIANCARIVSSALHGLVIADALGIPNQWTLFSDNKIVGHGFKFRDYYSAFNIDDPIPYRFLKEHTLRDVENRIEWEPKSLEPIRDGLLEAFPRELVEEKPRYEERNRMIANLIPAGVSVLDLGAGQQTLKRCLPGGCEYQPCDLIPSEGTIECDFNASAYPILSKGYDFVVVSGLLEYIQDPMVFLKTILGYGQRVVLTYAQQTPGQTIEQRQGSNWVNHFTRGELERVLTALEVDWELVTTWNEQLIYRLAR